MPKDTRVASRAERLSFACGANQGSGLRGRRRRGELRGADATTPRRRRGEDATTPRARRFFTLLRPRGTLCFVGMCPPISADVFTMGFTMHNITTSNTGGRKEMVEMLEFCARNKIGARVVERPLAKVNEVLAELESSKGAQRFVLTA